MTKGNSKSISDPEFWKVELGLLPVPLYFGAPDERRFVMLNGAKGNFCLDVEGAVDIPDARNIAWSSNVGHYVSIRDNFVEIKRWDASPSRTTRLSALQVLRDLEAFHSDLEQDAPYGLSVVSHSIRVFRKLRAVLGQSFDGIQSLKAFLLLLASSKDSKAISDIPIVDWQLPEDATTIATHIRPGDWDALVDELLNGRAIEGLRPDLSIVLTHAVGELFQEAHFEAVNIPQDQLRLEGFLPRPADTKFVPTIKGVHFTPPALSRALVEEALYLHGSLQSEISVFDPACGSGEFLREALRQIRMLGSTAKVRLIGWDISEAACDMARFSLAYEEKSLRDPLEVTIEQHDSIEGIENWPRDIDLLLMNPPFVSWQDMTSIERQSLRSVLGDLWKGRPDLSFAFMLGALNAIGKGGVLASIIPASFLDSDSASLLRERIKEELSLFMVARLGSHSLFARSIVDTGLFVAQRAELDKLPTAFWSDHRSTSTSRGLRTLRRRRLISIDEPNIGKGFSIYPNPGFALRSASWAPRPFKSWKLAQDLASLPRVRDLFSVRQGARTGRVGVFVLADDQYRSLTVEEKRFFRPAVVNRAIKNGYLSQISFVFYPYGEQQISSESELRSLVPDYYARYLLPNKEHLVSRARIKPDFWWGHSEHRTWQVERRSKIVSTYFGDAGSFAWDSTGDFVVVQGLAWMPRKEEFERELPPKVGLSYLALLNSESFSELLAASSNHVAGGQWNLSKKFVDSIPIPDLTSRDFPVETVDLLSEVGTSIHLGEQVDWEHANSLVRDVLGIDQPTNL
ncbi:MAG: N-6 DNA methylase [Chloroflexi bacterium]|nr:N-6 DNA methylase [Chloroflexota bacterium]